MALQNLIYDSDKCLPSCIQGAFELQVGEEVKIELNGKNPLWPAFIVGTIVAVAPNSSGRQYTIEFDDADLNGGAMFDGCDIVSIACLDCCDVLAACPTEIPADAFADPAAPTQGEALTWLASNPQRPLSKWFAGGTVDDPEILIQIHDCGPVVIKKPSSMDSDDKLTFVSQSTDPDTGNTTVTWQLVDINGDPVGPPIVQTIPGTIDTDTKTQYTGQSTFGPNTVLEFVCVDKDGNPISGSEYTILVPKTVDTDIRLTVVGTSTDPTSGDTTVTFQYVDKDGNPIGSQFTSVTPGLTAAEACALTASCPTAIATDGNAASATYSAFGIIGQNGNSTQGFGPNVIVNGAMYSGATPPTAPADPGNPAWHMDPAGNILVWDYTAGAWVGLPAPPAPVDSGDYEYNATSGQTTHTQSDGTVQTEDTNVFNPAGDEGGAINSPTSTVAGPTEEDAIKQLANNRQGWRYYLDGLEVRRSDDVPSTTDWQREGSTAIGSQTGITMRNDHVAAVAARNGGSVITSEYSATIASNLVNFTGGNLQKTAVSATVVDDDAQTSGRIAFVGGVRGKLFAFDQVAAGFDDVSSGTGRFFAGGVSNITADGGAGSVNQAILGSTDIDIIGNGAHLGTLGSRFSDIESDAGQVTTSAIVGAGFSRILGDGGTGTQSDQNKVIAGSTNVLLTGDVAQVATAMSGGTLTGVSPMGYPADTSTIIGANSHMAAGRAIHSPLEQTLVTQRIQFHAHDNVNPGDYDIDTVGAAGPVVVPPLAASGLGTCMIVPKPVAGVWKPHSIDSVGTIAPINNFHPAVADALISAGAPEFITDPTTHLNYKYNTISGNLSASFGNVYIRVNLGGKGEVLNGEVSDKALGALTALNESDFRLTAGENAEARWANVNASWKALFETNLEKTRKLVTDIKDTKLPAAKARLKALNAIDEKSVREEFGETKDKDEAAQIDAAVKSRMVEIEQSKSDATEFVKSLEKQSSVDLDAKWEDVPFPESLK